MAFEADETRTNLTALREAPAMDRLSFALIQAVLAIAGSTPNTPLRTAALQSVFELQSDLLQDLDTRRDGAELPQIFRDFLSLLIDSKYRRTTHNSYSTFAPRNSASVQDSHNFLQVHLERSQSFVPSFLFPFLDLDPIPSRGRFPRV